MDSTLSNSARVDRVADWIGEEVELPVPADSSRFHTISRLEASNKAAKHEIIALSRTVDAGQGSGAAWLDAHALSELKPRLAALGVHHTDDVRGLSQPKRLLLQAGLSDGQLSQLSNAFAAIAETDNGLAGEPTEKPSASCNRLSIAPLQMPPGQEAPWSLPRPGKYGSRLNQSLQDMTRFDSEVPFYASNNQSVDNDVTILSGANMALRLEQGRKDMKEQLRRELIDQLSQTNLGSNPFGGTDNREAVATPAQSHPRKELAEAWESALREERATSLRPMTHTPLPPHREQIAMQGTHQSMQQRDLDKIEQLELQTSMQHLEAAATLRTTLDDLSAKLVEQYRVIDGMKTTKELEKKARVQAEKHVAALQYEVAVLKEAQGEHEAWSTAVGQRHQEGEIQVRSNPFAIDSTCTRTYAIVVVVRTAKGADSATHAGDARGGRQGYNLKAAVRRVGCSSSSTGSAIGGFL
jgi:hypothetical protein